MRTVKCTLLIFFTLRFFACTSVQETFVPSPQNQTSTAAYTTQPTSTPYMRPTETTKTQITPTPSATQGLLDQLSSGTYIAYAGNEGSGFNSIPSIHILSLDGQDIGILATNIPGNATISPDGQKIAYINFTAPGFSNLTVFDLKTYQYNSFYISGCFMASNTTAWSPDSIHIAVSCGDFISIADITDITGEVARISSSLALANGKDYEIWDPAWSFDGHYLSFYISNPNDAHDSSAHGPYLTDPRCPGNATECQITPYELRVTDLSMSKWTPDNLLAVAQENHINLFDPVGKKLVGSIAIPVDTPILSFAWSPDNQWIAYSVASQNPNTLAEEIYIISHFGGKPILLSDNADDVMFWFQVSNR